MNKGTHEEPEVRCRLVARDFKPKGEKEREDLFAATPPLEAKKLLFRMAAAQAGAVGQEDVKLLFIDVKRAQLNGVVDEETAVYVELPAEVGALGKCGRLKRWLYGMRPAASAWERDYADKLTKAGFVRGRAAPTVFYNAESGVRGVVHGDDFSFLGREAELRKVVKLMGEWYSIKVRGILGGRPGDDKRITILGRNLIWGEQDIWYEADGKHAKHICKGMGLDESSKGISSPAEKEQPGEEDDEVLGRAGRRRPSSGRWRQGQTT